MDRRRITGRYLPWTNRIVVPAAALAAVVLFGLGWQLNAAALVLLGAAVVLLLVAELLRWRERRQAGTGTDGAGVDR